MIEVTCDACRVMYMKDATPADLGDRGLRTERVSLRGRTVSVSLGISVMQLKSALRSYGRIDLCERRLPGRGRSFSIEGEKEETA